MERVNKLQESISNVSWFIDKVKRYTEILELTSEILHLIIGRIDVGERNECYFRTVEQKINNR